MVKKYIKTKVSKDLNKQSNSLLLIFTRNPELGKCKTRLAATIGNEKALDAYKFLLTHTANITKDVNSDKAVYYSEEIWENDSWDAAIFQKKEQKGIDLGERMLNAFKEGFAQGYQKILIIGSDMFDLSTTDINEAFEQLSHNDFVIGPALDGGYYLLGMTQLQPALFKNKAWGTGTVLKDTLNDLKDASVHQLNAKNDIDTFEDIKDVAAFQPILNNTIHDKKTA